MRGFGIFSWLALALAFLAGCGSDTKSGDPGSSGDAGPSGDPGPSLDAGSGVNPGTMPCNIHSGYEGDEYCILPPDPSKGLQLHYGPQNYDDPAEVAKYLLMPGAEKTDCIFVKTPNDIEVFHAEYHGRMRPGSHHLLVFTQSSPIADSAGPQGCNQGTDTAMILGAQTPTVDIDNTRNPAPENEGTAQRLAPHAQAVIQVHYLNTSTKPILREAWANVIYRDPSTVKTLIDPIFFLAGLAANIQSGTTQVSRGQATASREMRLVSATGHYHAHTVRFSAFSVIAGQRNQILEDYDWHEPTMFTYDSIRMNSTWDPAERKAGASSGILNLNAGDKIEWECEVVNNGTVPLRFGNAVETAEMCNMFGFYAPSMGGPWSASNL